ncbi:MAG: SPOR domain-containing protein [Endozoicomonas sp.]
MRWIVLLLFFLNAGYFAWGFYQQSQDSYARPVVQQTVPPEQGKRLVLYSESPQAKKTVEPEPQTVSPVEESVDGKPEVSATVGQCLVLGPFSSATKADNLQQRLFAVGVGSRERSDGEATQADFWVHIPPLASRVNAIRMLRELQGQGIDSFVITQGELSNGISLGLFSREASANEVSRRLLEAGYETRIKQLARSPETYWLEMDLKESRQITDRFWSELGDDYKELKMLEKNCKGIASGGLIH